MKLRLKAGLAGIAAASMVFGGAMVANAATADDCLIKSSELEIMVASDIHVFAEELWKGADGTISPDFQAAIDGDRKMMPQSQEIFDRYIDTVIEQHPDILLISGDLTKDGEVKSHEFVAAQLRQVQDAGIKVFVTNGNHDINTPNIARDYTTQPATVADWTSPDEYASIYSSILNDDTITAKYELPAGAQAGRFSYVAQPAEGYTLVVLDGGKYTADNTSHGLDQQQTGGNYTEDLLNWADQQIKAADERGDVVIGMTHWGINEHFSLESDILSDYLIDDFELVQRRLMNDGLDYIFTGHMHANDISVLQGTGGKRLVDIETGSMVTYPSPSRTVNLARDVQGTNVTTSVDISTRFGLDGLSFTDDLVAFGQEATGFEPGVMKNLVPGFLNEYADQIIAQGGIEKWLEANWTQGLRVGNLLSDLLGGSQTATFAEFKSSVLVPQIESALTSANEMLASMDIGGFGQLGYLYPKVAPAIVDELFAGIDRSLTRDENGRVPLSDILADALMKLVEIEVVPGHTLLDVATYAYQTHLRGDENPAEHPEWVEQVRAKLADGSLLTELVTVFATNAYDDVLLPFAKFIKTPELLNMAGLDSSYAGVPIKSGLPAALDFEFLPGLLLSQLYFDRDSGGPADYVWKDIVLDLAGFLTHTENVLADLNGLGSGVTVRGAVTGLLQSLLIGTPEEPGLLGGDTAQLAGGFLVGFVDSLLTDENGSPDGSNHFTTKHTIVQPTCETPTPTATSSTGEEEVVEATLAISPESASAAESTAGFQLTGTGWGANKEVTISVNGPAGLAAKFATTANAEGAIAQLLTWAEYDENGNIVTDNLEFPAGKYEVTATNGDQTHTVSFEVVGAPEPTDEPTTEPTAEPTDEPTVAPTQSVKPSATAGATNTAAPTDGGQGLAVDGGKPQLPSTGAADVMPIVFTSAIVLAAGALLVVYSRRRTRA